MKKLKNFNLLLILTILVTISTSSCDVNTVHITGDMPIEVKKLQEKQQFDTLITIQTDNKIYFYDKNNQYCSSYINTKEDLIWVVIVIVVVMWVSWLVGYIQGSES